MGKVSRRDITKTRYTNILKISPPKTEFLDKISDISMFLLET